MFKKKKNDRDLFSLEVREWLVINNYDYEITLICCFVDNTTTKQRLLSSQICNSARNIVLKK